MINTAALSFALGAGLVAALNPCGFAFLPGYLGLVIAGSQGTSRPRAVLRAGAATAGMSLGFLTVFGVFGLLISPVIASAQRYLPFATVVIGVLLVGLAIWLLAGKELSIILSKSMGGTPTTRLGSMYGYGVGYAVASLSCTVAPFLAVISTTFKQGSVLSGVLAFVAYAVGMTLTVGVAALTVALAGSSATAAFRRILPFVGRIAGVIVLITGLYVAYYGYYEIRLYFTRAETDDPVIQAASTLQDSLIRLVDGLSPWLLLGVAAALVAVAVGWHTLARRRASNPAAQSLPDPTS
ncbi:cytochrome c biogenesis CcdA family protein [Mycobacterium ulcerans]|uniref:Cytochrome c biogenesis CcdA family protein n=1 Tax=Mycobacterium ulcerans TaxID=1809 RepID=A0ABY3V8K9_MYCUL|nr:cytochrome c biogenesis CcdA family protein [Mycobacterium ulcerans]MEB3969133.1 cytochrome c biogenesis CcdA family protein [Mycobacterium ulcerans]MEB3977344.1 cytochrome c biogenesis CcdA family protein [Mycobacterium ulcerans]MEB4006712.1 cytochrome c biogenesis CcdA family protein [Mycobacterium ulcerans]MEB4416260.1 cytochrome c biogenesis CcdA family protein [Mycobacterium ulcerans]MEB4434444.1 cytochrome c biogenesis CcdA family protein [Mycobacterium ulcerans]